MAKKNSPVPPRGESSRMQGKIAIVGSACRLPGADSIDAFRALLLEGRAAIGPIPSSREGLARGVSRAGLLEHVEDFDPAFFGLAQREADQMDPQQRILLELTVEALEAAGIPRQGLAGSRTGVYIGIASSDYSRLQSASQQPLDLYAGTGNALSIAANRISYWLDLAGPSLALDTACSSSLNAIHLAVRALRSGEIELALVGGVNLLLAGDLMEIFANARMLAPDGACKTFDAAADGYGRGEGAVVLVLRRAADALAAGDQVLALIAGSAANQDGRSNGLTAPSGPAQVAVIKAALADANLRAADIDAVELHGTGTPLGDPIEAQALAQALRTESAAPLLVGSVKTNIGHLEAAAGIAGLLKAALALHLGVLPPSLNFHRANPQIDLSALNLRVVTESVALTAAPDRPARMGVSSFGFGGSNAHVILESAPPSVQPPWSEPPAAADWLLPVSAADPSALRQLAARYAEWLAHVESNDIGGLLHAAAARRDHLDYRLVVRGDRASLIAGLRAAANADSHPALQQGRRPAAGARKLALLGTSDGRLAGARVDRCIDSADALLARQLSGRWDLLALAGAVPAQPSGRIRVLTADDATDALALLYVHGHDLDWSKIHPPARWPGLPSYPWQRHRCWFRAMELAPTAGPLAASEHRAANTYRLDWLPLPTAQSRPDAKDGKRRWLLIDSIVGDSVTETLRRRLSIDGDQVEVLIVHGDLEQRRAAIATALTEPGAPYCGVLHLDGLRPGQAAARFLAGLATIQALIAAEPPATRLWIVTRGVQALAGHAPADPAGAVLLGLARTLANEAPRISGGCLDLCSDTSDPCGDAARLCEVIGHGHGEPELAWRDGRWWLPRLRPAPRVETAPAALRGQGIYLITGAFGGLGGHLLAWLIKRGARRIALLGRNPPTAAASAQITALRNKEVRIENWVCDVGDSIALRAAIDKAEATLGGTIAGVVHAAGSHDGAMLASMTAFQVNDVFSGKLDGALCLLDALRERSLDLCVLISSAAATFGMPGNGNYNAANAVLVALAASRRAAGLVATAIGPAPITGVGMETRAPASLRERWRQIGIQPLSPESLLDAVERSGDAHHQLVLPIDWNQAAVAFGTAIPPLLSECVTPLVSAKNPAPPEAWRKHMAALPTARRRGWLEQRIGELLAKVLRLPSGQLPEPTLGLQAQGMDSLMALEFHEQLERASGLRLPATLALETPSLRGLVSRLAPLFDDVQPARPLPSPPLPIAPPRPFENADLRQLLGDIEALDDIQAEQQLITLMEDV